MSNVRQKVSTAAFRRMRLFRMSCFRTELMCLYSAAVPTGFGDESRTHVPLKVYTGYEMRAVYEHLYCVVLYKHEVS